MTCSFDNHILSCGGLSSISSNQLIRFQSEKVKGSVTWTNLKQLHIPIPLTYQLPLTEAFGAFFTDRWNFLLKSSYTDTAPIYSIIIIDIIQNSQETTATCELLTQGQGSNNNQYVFCVSELETQSESDTIEISQTKKSGTVTWKTEITDDNKNVAKISTAIADIKTKELDFIDSYDMYFSNNKWIFTILSRSSNNDVKGEVGIYKVDISVTKSSETLYSTATCLLYDGINSKEHFRFLCSCDYDSQSKDDLIKIHYPKTDSSTINWLKDINDDYSITLNTRLTIKLADTLEQNSFGGYWTFKVEIERMKAQYYH